jgi:hypothetical protein
MDYRKKLEEECKKRVERYYEEQKKFDELLSQFVSIAWIETAPLKPPKRAFDLAGIKEINEAEQKLDKLRKEMDKAIDALYRVYH